MFEVSNETLFECTPAQLWEALVNFNQYERWNPYVRPKGIPSRGQEVPYWLRMKPDKPGFWRVSAIVTELEPRSRLAFDVKLSWLLSVEERYVLERRPQGTLLIHSFRCKGLIARLRLNKARRNFEGILSETDRFLVRYISRSQAKPIPKAKHPKNGRRR